jgi:hypothetical protein
MRALDRIRTHAAADRRVRTAGASGSGVWRRWVFSLGRSRAKPGLVGAERLVYGVATTGTENDLQQVTDARRMVLRWG